MEDIAWIDDIINNHQKSKNYLKIYILIICFIVLNDFNNHRNNTKNKVPNILTEEDNLDMLNSNNIESINEFKNNQINLSNDYNKNLK